MMIKISRKEGKNVNLLFEIIFVFICKNATTYRLVLPTTSCMRRRVFGPIILAKHVCRCLEHAVSMPIHIYTFHTHATTTKQECYTVECTDKCIMNNPSSPYQARFETGFSGQ